MYTAYWDTTDEGLQITTIGENGKSTFKAPIRQFFKAPSAESNIIAKIASQVCPDIIHVPSDFIDTAKKPCDTFYVSNPTFMPQIRDKCYEAGFGHKHVLEADIDFIHNWMLEKDIRCTQTYSKLFYDIEVWDKDGMPSMTGKYLPIISIAAVDQDGKEYFFTGKHSTLEEAMESEKAILLSFIGLIRAKHYGACIGYYSGGGNVGNKMQGRTGTGFDYPMLRRAIKDHHKIPFRFDETRWIDLVVPFIYFSSKKWKSTSLDYVSNQLFGGHKKRPVGKQYIADYTYDELREYNLTDAQLTKKIDETAIMPSGALTDLLIEIAYECHIFPDKVLFTQNLLTGKPNPAKAVDSLQIEEARHLKYALFSKPNQAEAMTKVDYKGALVIKHPVPGVHNNVLIVDVESLYPFCMMLLKTSPDPDGLIVPNILKRYLEKKRKASKQPIKREAYKLILNVQYGRFGSRYTRIYDITKAAAIAAMGKEILIQAISIVESKGLAVAYGDTDSIFIELPEDPRELGMTINQYADGIAKHINTQMRKTYTSKDFEFNMPWDKFAKEMFFMRKGGSDGEGSKKKYYCHITCDAKKGDCDYYYTKGTELIKRDQFALLAKTQEEILKLKLKGQDDIALRYVLDLKSKLLAGEIAQSDLVISKGFGKDCYEHEWQTTKHMDGDKRIWKCTKCGLNKSFAGEPKNSIPVQVLIRNKLIELGQWNGQESRVRFIVTKHGPEPYIENVKLTDIDYKKYYNLVANMARRAEIDVPLERITKPKSFTKKTSKEQLDSFLFSS